VHSRAVVHRPVACPMQLRLRRRAGRRRVAVRPDRAEAEHTLAAKGLLRELASKEWNARSAYGPPSAACLVRCSCWFSKVASRWPAHLPLPGVAPEAVQCQRRPEHLVATEERRSVAVSHVSELCALAALYCRAAPCRHTIVGICPLRTFAPLCAAPA